MTTVCKDGWCTLWSLDTMTVYLYREVSKVFGTATTTSSSFWSAWAVWWETIVYGSEGGIGRQRPWPNRTAIRKFFILKKGI